MANRVVEILVSVKDEAISFFGRLGDAISAVKDHVTSLSGVMELLFTGAVMEGIKAAVETFAEFDMTLVRVNAALQVSGRYTREGSEEIQRMANTMQDLTVASREAALQVSATVGALARELSPTQLAEVQKAAIGLSETFGISLERAASLIGRTMEGNFNALHRYGIEIDMAGTQQERFTQLMEKMAPLFTISKEAADTFAGAMEQAKNQFVEIERTFGEIVANALGLDSPKSIRDALKRLNTALRENAGEWIRYAKIVVDTFELIGVALVTVGVKITEFVNDKVSGLSTAFEKLHKLNTEILDWIGGNKVVATAGSKQTGLNGVLESILASIGSINDAWVKLMKDINAPPKPAALPKIGAQEHKGLENVGGQVEDVPNEILHETAVTHDLAEQIKILNTERQAGTISNREYGLQFGQLNLDITQEVLRLRELLDVNGLTLTQRAALNKLLEQALVAQRALNNLGLNEALRASKEIVSEEKLLEEQYKAHVISLKEYAAARKALIADTQQQIDKDKALLAGLRQGSDEYNKLLQQIRLLQAALDALGKSGKTAGEQIIAAFHGIYESAAELRAEMLGLADATINASIDAAAGAIASGKSVTDALKNVAKTEEKQALAMAIKYTAEGIAGDPKMFAAAAEMFAAAAAFAIIGGGGGGSSGGGGASSAQQTTSAVSNSGQRGDAVFIIPAGFTNDPNFLDGLAEALNEMTGRNVLVRAQG